MENALKIQRYFVLLSGGERPVLSSLIARAKKPSKGEWLEVNLRPCCTVKTAIGSPSGTQTTVTVKSRLLKLADLTVTATTASEVVDLLNSTFPAMGTFSEDGEFFYLKTAVVVSPSITVAYS